MKKIKFIILILISLIAVLISQKICIFEDYNPTVIVEKHKFNNLLNHNLYKGNKINGEFVANNNNLGIISINFDTHWDINTDFLQFSIKEKGQNKWYYTNKYKVDQFQNKKYFPFGFPEISNSKNKTYQIEIESLNGTPGNSVFASPNKKPFLSKYSFPKSYLLQNKNQISVFIFNKIGSLFRHVEFLDYVFITAITIFIFAFFKSKNGKWLLQYFKEKNKFIKSNDSIFYWYFWTLGLVVLISFAVILIKKHNESSEWLIYELSAVISFFALIKFTIFNKKIQPKTIKKTLVISIIFIIAQLIFFKFYLEIISWRYLVLASLSLIPAILYNNRLPENFLKILLINLISIVCVSGYFVIDIDSYPQISFLIILFFVAIFPLILINKNISINSRFFKIICLLILSIFIIFSINKPIEYHHYSFYIGPAYEISQHKSILTQAPSQYGYLSIHFIKNILSPVGINFSNFHWLNLALYFLYFIGAYLIFLKVIKNVLISTVFSLIVTALQSIFSIYSSAIYPSCGPLRFGIGMLIILLTLYLNKNKRIFIPTLLSSIALFWSIETAIYVIPAWIFALVCQNYIDSPKIKTFILRTVKQLGIFLGITILIFTIIFISEWNHIKSIPNILSYLQFANTYVDGFCSELMTIFGNYYLIIAILILGLSLSIYLTINKIKNNLTLVINFIAIHNIAVFSYFVSRSNQNNIINISIFLFIELVICYKIIESIFFKNKSKKLFQITIFPIVMFITLFTVKCFYNATHQDQIQHSTLNNQAYIENYKIISKKYNLSPNNVLIINKDYSAQIIAEFKINTILPLNPTIMTTLLPDYQNKYLIPNLDKINIGTTLVYAKDMPDLFNFFEQHFKLKPISKPDTNELFDLFVFENK